MARKRQRRDPGYTPPCSIKLLAFKSRSKAERYLKNQWRVNPRYDRSARPYDCPHCGLVHLTTSPHRGITPQQRKAAA